MDGKKFTYDDLIELVSEIFNSSEDTHQVSYETPFGIIEINTSKHFINVTT